MAQRQSKKSQNSLQRPKIQDDVLHEQMPISPLIKALQRDNELIEAAKNADYEKVRLLLEEGVNVNAMDKELRTALHWAVLKRRIDICRLLVEKGANVNAGDKNKKTPLMFSARSGKTDMCVFLLLKGADANATNTSGGTVPDYAETYDIVQLITNWAILPKLLGDGFATFKASFAECTA